MVAVVLLWTAFAAVPETFAQFQPEIYTVLGRKRETGFKVGRGRFHLALGVVGTYDSNALYSDTGPKADYVLQLIPGGDFVWGGDRLTLQTGYRFTHRKDFKESAQDFDAHTASLESKYRFSRRVSLDVKEQFERSSDPASVQLPERLKRWANEAGGGLTYTSSSENMETAVHYTHTYQKYDEQLAALNFFTNRVSLMSRINVSSRFRFLPKSTASIGAEYGQANFRNNPSVTVQENDSKGVSGTLSLSSRFTRGLSLEAGVGVASIFFESGPNALGVTGAMEAKYEPTLKTELTAGYRRTVQVSTFTNYYKQHRFSAGASWKSIRGFEVFLKNFFDFLDFSGPTVNADGTQRKDFLIQVLTGVAYSFREWCKARVEYQVDFRNSNTTDPVLGTASADFTKHRANVGIDFYY